jgi:hypoxanthine phosphoribosyltransferase
VIQLHDRNFEPFITADELDQIVSNMAADINRDYHGKCPVIVGILNGSFMFLSDLMKKLDIDCELTFLKFSSYHGTRSSGTVKELIGLADELDDRHVLVLEDIVDTGNTLEKILGVLEGHDLSSQKIGTLLMKPDVFNNRFELDYVGREIPDKFVVGYGLDYDELGRNLNQIYQLAEEGGIND